MSGHRPIRAKEHYGFPEREPENGVKRVFLALTRAQAVVTLLGVVVIVAGSWWVSMERIGGLRDDMKEMKDLLSGPHGLAVRVAVLEIQARGELPLPQGGK